MKIREEKPEPAFAHHVDFCYKKIEELKIRSSHLRKEGKDPTMAEFLMRNIITKLHYAEVSRSMQEIEKIKATLNDVKTELDEAEEHHEGSLMQEAQELYEKTKQ